MHSIGVFKAKIVFKYEIGYNWRVTFTDDMYVTLGLKRSQNK
jgi:hypothetical protein